MKTDFPQITILGAGLLGGSLALALAELENPPQVRLWARKQETVDDAIKLGISNVTGDLAEAVRDANLVILAVPVGSMADLVKASLEAGLPEGCVVTDVGSVKRVPHRKIGPLLKGSGIRFIGSHPMAGSERNGLSAVTSKLFHNAACLLTNDDGAPAEQTAAVERFWKTIGCRTSWMSASIHDELVARISHLPHIIAASAARVCLKDPSEGKFGGGGLRDTTRVAAGNPTMWAEIVIENREALTGLLRESIEDLREILASLENANQEQARKWLVTAKQRRDPLNSHL
ncbi:MAG: prephenate dehydrogenase/arogenate dehydrogenase family protein [Verrucomicrobiaceae bacterium]|nr:MAG: prephenate dehydrogenase/arogenate dehydrogenase family protein [Verrucomicrobiaceae bacterium]